MSECPTTEQCMTKRQVNLMLTIGVLALLVILTVGWIDLSTRLRVPPKVLETVTDNKEALKRIQVELGIPIPPEG